MDRRLDIADSTDWIGTPLASFQVLENALRCQVCKDFYDTPMITSCSHTFCSLCIRKSLTSDGKCPACRASDQASKLRRNWAVQEVVDAFQAARPAALKVAQENGSLKEGREARRNKLKRGLQDTDPEDLEEEQSFQARKTRSQTRRAAAVPSSSQEVISVADEEEEPRPDDGLVPCPICNKRMKEEAVYSHLDRCDGQPSSQGRNTRSRTSATSLKPRSLPQQSKATPPPMERLPQLSYSLLKDNALRKKLQELGISSWGPRQLLIRRHTEWVNLYNSNCDSSRPRSKRELLAELDRWERTQGGNAPNAGEGLTGVMRKDFDGQAWARNNKDHFGDLIAQARKRRGPSAAEKGNGAATEEGGTPQGPPVEDMNTEDNQVAVNGEPKATPNGETSSSTDSPYEGNEEALSIIRRKVEEANRGNSTPSSNTNESEDVPMPNALLPSEEAHADEMQTAIEPLSSRNDSSPLSPARKMPMFAVPEQPVEDAETGVEMH